MIRHAFYDRFRTALFSGAVLFYAAFAADPQKIASIDRTLWPESINTTQAFDKASRFEELLFLQCLNQVTDNTPDTALLSFTGLKSINRQSINQWLNLTRSRIISNFNTATAGEIPGIVLSGQKLDSVTIIAKSKIFGNSLPQNFSAWYNAGKTFYEYYLYEQIRLAALFPKITSEILTFSVQELNGFEFPDKQFLLTFDDGPTAKGGLTDSLTAYLKSEHIPGTFFILGSALRNRLKQSSSQELLENYRGMTIGSHGTEHQSHAKIPVWQNSLVSMNNLLDSVFNGEKAAVHPFRPPYGQRKDSASVVLSTMGSRCVLWNIDTQDWNTQMTAQMVKDRTITLMLLWRHGVLLFHDIHPKAIKALPGIKESVGSAGITWVDYNTLK